MWDGGRLFSGSRRLSVDTWCAFAGNLLWGRIVCKTMVAKRPTSNKLVHVAQWYMKRLPTEELAKLKVAITAACAEGRALRVGSMGSGTDSPIVVMKKLSKALKGQLCVEHTFSCEFDPRKREWIKENFQTLKLLVCDVNELKTGKATNWLTEEVVTVPSFDPLQVPQLAQAKAATKAMVAPKAKAAPKAIATPKVIAKAKARQGGVSAQSILAKLVFRDGFAELKALLQATGKGEQNVWYWANKTRSDGWTRIDLYQKEQRDYQSSRRGAKRKKLGGSGPWFASRTLCLHLLALWGHL